LNISEEFKFFNLQTLIMPGKPVRLQRTLVDGTVREVMYFLKRSDETNPVIRVYKNGDIARGKYRDIKIEGLASVRRACLGAMELDAITMSKTKLELKYPNIEVSDLALSTKRNLNSNSLFTRNLSLSRRRQQDLYCWRRLHLSPGRIWLACLGLCLGR
jgi:hypothetical protein